MRPALLSALRRLVLLLFSSRWNSHVWDEISMSKFNGLAPEFTSTSLLLGKRGELKQSHAILLPSLQSIVLVFAVNSHDSCSQ